MATDYGLNLVTNGSDSVSTKSGAKASNDKLIYPLMSIQKALEVFISSSAFTVIDRMRDLKNQNLLVLDSLGFILDLLPSFLLNGESSLKWQS